MQAVNGTSGLVLASLLRTALTPWSRARGLLGSKGLRQGEGLLLRPCIGVHTFFMRYPIDVVFLDRNNRVLAMLEGLKPQRISRLVPASRGVIELPAGTVAVSGTRLGDEIKIG